MNQSLFARGEQKNATCGYTSAPCERTSAQRKQTFGNKGQTIEGGM